jgi:hypothetical protein
VALPLPQLITAKHLQLFQTEINGLIAKLKKGFDLGT